MAVGSFGLLIGIEVGRRAQQEPGSQCRGRGAEPEHHLPVLIHCQSSGALAAGGRLEKFARRMCSCLHGLLPKVSSRLLFLHGYKHGRAHG